MYSWRLSEDLKSDLEREARLRKVSVAAILELAVRDWLDERGADTTGDEEQARLQQAATSCLGAFAGRNSRRAETVRETVRGRLGRRYAR